MRKARLFTAVTVDGCLVENLDWLPDTQGQTFLFDHQTWKQLEPRLKPAEHITVLSPRPKAPASGIQYETGSAADCLRRLKEEDGGTIWVLAGPKTVNQLMKTDLIDYYELVIVPQIGGSGPRLFKPGGQPLDLKLKRHAESDGLVFLSYEREL